MDAQGNAEQRIAQALEVIRAEVRAISGLEASFDAAFLTAVDRLLTCDGMVVVTGMGKAGLVGAKISATLASTGTPSIFLHPAEALHGDLGRIRSVDVVLAFSNSGETAEVVAMAPRIRRIGAGLIAVTGEARSSLARATDCVLDLGRVDEACPMGLAPTASTAAMLALGDALAVVVQTERGFSRDDYALVHPSGSLGRRLMRVEEVMRQGEALPLAPSGTAVTDVILTMSRTPGRPGAALILDGDGKLAGIFTDGDLRRLLERGEVQRLSEPVDEFMGRDPKTVAADSLLEEAEQILRENQIDQIPVLDDAGHPTGLLDVQDILRSNH